MSNKLSRVCFSTGNFWNFSLTSLWIEDPRGPGDSLNMYVMFHKTLFRPRAAAFIPSVMRCLSRLRNLFPKARSLERNFFTSFSFHVVAHELEKKLIHS